LPRPEKAVRWLHVEPGGWIGATVTSEVYYYRRHCLGDKECPLCKRGIPWRMRYVVQVEVEDGVYLLELGGPQYEFLASCAANGGICGRRVEIRRAHRGKTAKIELLDRGIDPGVGVGADIGRLVDAVEACLADPPGLR
jgi:hypothetical protein